MPIVSDYIYIQGEHKLDGKKECVIKRRFRAKYESTNDFMIVKLQSLPFLKMFYVTSLSYSANVSFVNEISPCVYEHIHHDETNALPIHDLNSGLDK